MSKSNDIREQEKKSKGMLLFKKLTAIPYLLIFFALMMPFANVSCTGASLAQKKVETSVENSTDSTKANVAQAEAPKTVPQVTMEEKVLMEPSFYSLLNGLNLEESMSEEGATELKRFEKSGFLTALKARTPDYPKLPAMTFLWAILIGVFLTAVFAWITPLGSIALGMLTWVAMWGMLAKFGEMISSMGIPILKVEPGIGIYAATFMIFFGTAMNLATIIRPIVVAIKNRKK